MKGAIIGDIVGSQFEGVLHSFDKSFELFTRRCRFTDDTVMTLAVAKALINNQDEKDEKKMFFAFQKEMQAWGRKYPLAGYGGKFRFWILHPNPKPYGSFGNGSAMRVSPVGWRYETIGETRQVAAVTAAVTHNHPEGIKGAEATASAIFLARNNASKDEIKAYISKEFDYNLDLELSQIRKTHTMDVSCQVTVPVSIIAFLESADYEDAIRNAVALGGDTDTQGAITGSIAEAFYGIPDVLWEKALFYLDERIKSEIDYWNVSK